jgi:chromosome partitioning protein
MRTITILNEKGGVGKTTLATHIAAGLATRGRRVLLIDADAQANATTQLGVPEWGGVYRLLAQDAPWSDVLRSPALPCWAGEAVSGSLWLLPSNVETRVIPMVVDDAGLLRERLEDIEEQLDVVVIDTAPTPSMLHSIIYMATDLLLFPTQCEALSVESLSRTLEHMHMLNRGRQALGLGPAELLGVQPTMADTRTNAHRLGLSFLLPEFKRSVWPAMQQRTIYRDASWARQTLFAYAPEDEATTEAWALVERVMKGIA